MGNIALPHGQYFNVYLVSVTYWRKLNYLCQNLRKYPLHQLCVKLFVCMEALSWLKSSRICSWQSGQNLSLHDCVKMPSIHYNHFCNKHQWRFWIFKGNKIASSQTNILHCLRHVTLFSYHFQTIFALRQFEVCCSHWILNVFALHPLSRSSFAIHPTYSSLFVPFVCFTLPYFLCFD